METANRFRSAVRVLKGMQAADGKSATSLMLLEAPRDTQLTIEACGDDEAAAVDTLVNLVERRFGELAEQ